MKKSFGEKLRELRGVLSQTEFSQKISAKQNSLSSWERGEKIPSIDVIKPICESCGCSADWLLGIDESAKSITATNSAVHTSGSTSIKVHTECRDCPTVARLTEAVLNLSTSRTHSPKATPRAQAQPRPG